MAGQQEFESIVAAFLDLPVDGVRDDLARGKVPAWDSLLHLQLLSALEEVFAVTFTTRELAGLSSVGGLRGALRSRGVAA